MTFSAIKHAGLGCLLAVLLVVVYVGHQHSRSAVEASQIFIERYLPAQERINHVKEALFSANMAFVLFSERETVGPRQVIEPLAALISLLTRLSERELDFRDRIEPVISAARRAQFALRHLEQQPADGAADTNIKLRDAALEAMAAARRSLLKVKAGLPLDRLSPAVQITIRNGANILLQAEMGLQAYLDQERIDYAHIIRSTEEAQASLERLDADEIPQDLAEELASLRMLVAQYRNTLVRFGHELDRGTLEWGMEGFVLLRDRVNELWADIEAQLFAVRGGYERQIKAVSKAIVSDGTRGQRLFLMMAGIGVLLAILTSTVLSRVLSLRLDDLVRGARRFAAGDLDYRISTARGDEFGQLASAFNSMAETLKAKAAQLDRNLFELARANETIRQANGELEDRVRQRTEALETAIVEAQAANLAKSTFLAGMSHEIRTPLNGVIGMTEVLATTPLDERQAHQVRIIQRSGQALLALINDVLDLAKIEAGKLDLDDAPFKPRELVEDVASLFSETARAKGLTLCCDLPGDVPMALHGDGLRLRQVLVNLVNNAIKFTERGTITIRVIVVDSSVNNNGVVAATLRFAVEDTGIGIARDARARIFESFTQADGSTTRRYGGTGLGLAISAQLVTMMGGRLDVDSEPGQGSTFGFMVTLEKASHAPVGGDGSVAAFNVLEPALPPSRVLLVEDNPVNQFVALSMLEGMGMVVEIADNGHEALIKLEACTPDLILMDCQMPKMDGFAATAEIRRREDAAGEARRPIVALTANAVTGDRERCLAAGMDDYLSKPFSRDQLASVLAAWLMA